MLKLNLGCGTTKFDSYVNIDIEPTCNPDLVCNFIMDTLPYEDGTVDEIVLFHTIEHIRKVYHNRVLIECLRVLKVDGKLIVSFPEFLKCVENWKSNKYGIKEKWEQTIFGRQLYPSDYHVALMHGGDFTLLLRSLGFINVRCIPEPGEDFNSVVYATRGSGTIVSHEELLKQDMERTVICK